MTDVDTSSYPKLPTTQQNPLDTISKIQGIESNQLGIDRQKIAKYNEQYNVVHRTLGNLVNEPDLTGDHFINAYQGLVKAGVMTPEQAAKEMSMVPTKAGSKSEQDYQQRLRKLGETQLLQAEETHNAIGNYFGANADKDAGNQTAFGNQGQIRATGTGVGPSTFKQTGSSLIKNPAPGTPGVDQNNNPTFQPNAPPQYISPPGAVQSAPSLPSTGPTGATAQGNTFRPAPATNFTEGKDQYNKDIAVATDKLTQIKPAQQALKLMTPEVLSGLTGTGPIADKLTKGISAVNGVLGLKGDLADKVAARQEIVKKMNKYVSNSSVAGRSDAAQTLAEASSPNPNVQSLKALVNLTRDAIASDRVEAARALAFENKGNNYQEYQSHRANFPNNIDTDAFKLDLMAPKERDELIEKMKKSDNKLERERFINSLRIAKKLNMFD